MAIHRHEHVKSRLGELEKIKHEHIRQKNAGLGRTPDQPLTPHDPLTPQQHQQQQRDVKT